VGVIHQLHPHHLDMGHKILMIDVCVCACY
jgi:hypothetical protein